MSAPWRNPSRLELARAIILYAALAGMLLCWCLSGAYAAQAGRTGHSVVLRCENTPVSAARADAMKEAEARATEPIVFTAWRQLDSQTVSHAELNRRVQTALLRVRGDSSLVLPVPVRLALGDAEGCLIDRQTALSLFGDVRAEGASIKIGENTYIVRGVFSAPAGTVVVQASLLDALELDLVSVGAAGFADPRRAAEQFAMRHGLSPSMTVLSAGYAGWAGFFAQLPAWLMGLAALVGLLREALARKKLPVQRILLILATLAFAVLWVWMAEFRFSIPPDLIPTRWSDFEFWQRTAEQYRGRLTDLLLMKKTRPDVLVLVSFGKSALLSLAASTLFFCGVRRIRTDTPASFFTAAGFGLLASFGGVLAASETGMPLLYGRVIWLAPLLYFTVRFALARLAAARHAHEKGACPP